jgi:predicted ABC-type ATPase
VSRKKPPNLLRLLDDATKNVKKPLAFVLAGHNGSGKTTLWTERLSDALAIPLINADRLTLSMLPEPDRQTRLIPSWAQRLRDKDNRWQKLAQEGVRAFIALVIEQRVAFAFETVFSHWEQLPSGRFRSSKIEEIQNLQKAGYFVVLLFVGLVSAELSILRVQTRVSVGGHAVAKTKLRERFGRTQAAIGAASTIADVTIMLDNSRTLESAFSLARAQRRGRVLFDCRDPRYRINPDLRRVATIWLQKVVGAVAAPPRRH